MIFHFTFSSWSASWLTAFGKSWLSICGSGGRRVGVARVTYGNWRRLLTVRYKRVLMHARVSYNCIWRSNRSHIDMACCNHPLHVGFASRVEAMRTRWSMPVNIGRKVSWNSHVAKIIWTVWHARWKGTVIVLWCSVRHYRHLLTLMVRWTTVLSRISLKVDYKTG